MHVMRDYFPFLITLNPIFNIVLVMLEGHTECQMNARDLYLLLLKDQVDIYSICHFVGISFPPLISTMKCDFLEKGHTEYLNYLLL